MPLVGMLVLKVFSNRFLQSNVQIKSCVFLQRRLNTPIQLRSRASSLALQYEAPGVRFFSVWFSLGSIACVAVSIVEFTYSRKIVGNFLFIRSGIHIKSS